MTALTKTFEMQQTVRFQHCDPARIVFYPRYFEMVNQCVEAWFDEAIGISFGTMHEQLKIGIPTVDVNTQFIKPSRLEDRLVLRLQVVELGRASLRLKIEISSDEELRVVNQVTLVLVDLEQMKSVAWVTQPQLLQALQQY